MTISPSARLLATELAQARHAALKREYVERIATLLAAVHPPLSHAELAAALELEAPPEGRTGISEIGRFVSLAPRNRNAVPDRITRALIDRLHEGELCLAVEQRVVPGARRAALVCLPREAERLGRDWHVVRLGQTASGAGEAVDWDDDSVWSGGLVAPTAAPAPEAPPAAPPRAPARAIPAEAHAATTRAAVTARTPRRLSAAGPVLGQLGLGAMRLSTAGRPERGDAIALVHAALEHGVRLFDTADAYALDEDERGHNEALLREALATWSGRRGGDAVVATKGGMRRPGGRWLPDARPEHLVAACEASQRALGTDAIELYQLHVVDKRVPLQDSLEALAGLRARGLVRHIGLCNVGLEALAQVPADFGLACVQIALSPFDRAPFTSGLLEHCVRRDLTVLAYAPLGGHRRRERAGRDPVLAAQARRLGVSAYRLALAWLLELAPQIVPLPGATRLESLVDSALAPTLALDDEARAALDARLDGHAAAVRQAAADAVEVAPPEAPPARLVAASRAAREIVLVMGSPAAGKSTAARPLVEAGHVRLNRDELGGTLARLTRRLEAALEAEPTHSFVLDNTYPTRASRRDILALGRRHGVAVRAVVVDATLEDTLVNASWRMVERYGELLDPEAIAKLGKKDPNMFPPSVLYRHRALYEPPTLEEGFAEVECVPFRRALDAERFRHAALLLDLDGTVRTTRSGAPFPVAPDDVVLLPGRREALQRWAERGYRLLGVSNQSGIATGQLDAATAQACFERTAQLLGVELEVAFCPHASGRIGCWCRKPMPGLGVWHVQRHGLELGRCIMVGDLDSDREFARNLGVDYVEAEQFFSGTEVR